jgi:hypothetical protein
MFLCLSTSLQGLCNASFAQEGGSGIKGPIVSVIQAPVEMNADLRDLIIEVPLRRARGLIEVPLKKVPLPEVTPSRPGEEEIPFIPRDPIHLFKAAPEFSTADPNFDGIHAGDPGAFFSPPDTNGDVGPNHYIQVVNSSMAVFDKQGNTLAGPLPINALFVPLGGSCADESPIDPIVNYDPLADRWLVLGFPFASPICIAVSQTGDPVTGGWFLYAFDVASFPDYPKLGVWPDAYYLSTQIGTVDVYALDRSSMLNGEPVQVVHFSVGPPFLLPADLDGRPPKTFEREADQNGPRRRVSPPAPFARHLDGDIWGGVDRLELFEFNVDFDDPESSTFELVASLPTDAFRAVLCGDGFFGNCAEQPSGQKLETLPVWLMWRLQYRNFGGHETLVANHTIAVDSDLGQGAGIRWYELRRPHGGAWSIFQQGTFAPQDPAATSFLHRWMGSIAMDRKGNIALGFSSASADVFPSVRYVGRSAKDPLGLMPRGESPDGDIVMAAGENSFFTSRWGDYSSISVDPTDECTFWYTQEYMGTEGDIWRTRIGAFRFPSCH